MTEAPALPLMAPTFVPGQHVTYARDAVTASNATGPDVHVVPLGDSSWHVVPGGYPEQTYSDMLRDRDEQGRPLEWLAQQAEPGAYDRPCGCYPSILALRSQDTVEVRRLVMHHAYDGRQTGEQP